MVDRSSLGRASELTVVEGPDNAKSATKLRDPPRQNRRRGRHLAAVSIALAQRSITIHDGFTEVLEDSSTRERLCTESRGGPTWQFCPRFVRLRSHVFSPSSRFVIARALARSSFFFAACSASCGSYDPIGRSIDRSTLYHRRLNKRRGRLIKFLSLPLSLLCACMYLAYAIT